MTNHSLFIRDTGLKEVSSLSHLLDAIHPDIKDQSKIIERRF